MNGVQVAEVDVPKVTTVECLVRLISKVTGETPHSPAVRQRRRRSRHPRHPVRDHPCQRGSASRRIAYLRVHGGPSRRTGR